jgi:hypothetical protein
MPNGSSLVATRGNPMRLILPMSWPLREFHGGGQQRLIDVHVVLEIAQQLAVLKSFRSRSPQQERGSPPAHPFDRPSIVRTCG